jgi:hypothetical protein
LFEIIFERFWALAAAAAAARFFLYELCGGASSSSLSAVKSMQHSSTGSLAFSELVVAAASVAGFELPRELFCDSSKSIRTSHVSSSILMLADCELLLSKLSLPWLPLVL